MATMHINGLTYTGKNITVSNGRVVIDGKDVTPDTKQISIAVDGNVGTLKVDQCDKVAVNGSCEKVETMSGAVECGPVNGGVKTMSGDVKCGRVVGDVTTMFGDVDCGIVCGSARSTSGDVDYRTIAGDSEFMKFVAEKAPQLLEEFELEKSKA